MALWAIECRAKGEKRWRVLRVEYWKSTAERIMKLLNRHTKCPTQHRLVKYVRVRH